MGFASYLEDIRSKLEELDEEARNLQFDAACHRTAVRMSALVKDVDEALARAERQYDELLDMATDPSINLAQELQAARQARTDAEARLREKDTRLTECEVTLQRRVREFERDLEKCRAERDRQRALMDRFRERAGDTS